MKSAKSEYSREKLRKYRKLGLFFLALGLIFALESLTGYSHLVKLWPLIIASTGGGFIGIYCKRERRESLFLGLGVNLIFFSLFFLYCNFSSWGIVADLWPLFIMLPGLSFLLVYIFQDRSKLYLLLGLTLVSISLVFFLVFSLSSQLWWSIFFFLGISFFLIGFVKEK